MHSSLPQVPADTVTGRGGPSAVPSPLPQVLASARRRAQRDADGQVDTAHLLHSLLEADPRVTTAVGGDAATSRLLAYLVQRSIGYGLRWRGAVEGSRSTPAEGDAGRSPAAGHALRCATEAANARGEEAPRGLDLLAALAADPECRAVEVLKRASVDLAGLPDRIAADLSDD